jgi:hypothetical protein
LSEERVYIVLDEILDPWQKYTDEWMAANRADGYGTPPTEKCAITVDDTVVEGPLIEWSNYPETLSLTQTSFDVSVNVYTTVRITKVEFYWDDQLVITTNSQPYSVSYDISDIVDTTETGNHMIRVVAYDSEGSKNEKSVEVQRVNEDDLTPAPTGSATPTVQPSDE